MANIPRNIRTQLFKEMAKKYGRGSSVELRWLDARYPNKNTKMDRTTGEGQLICQGTPRVGYPKAVRFKMDMATGAIELTTDLNLLTAGKKMQWPENWQKRREAVMSCVNLNALEDLLETEKDSRVRPAIVKQIKGQVEA